jgi:hypothetical protein
MRLDPNGVQGIDPQDTDGACTAMRDSLLETLETAPTPTPVPSLIRDQARISKEEIVFNKY